ncbi:hypothetical protein [Acinetobacter nosocomialis]|uniref:hypothetical protein n=1 Tax=Acinetobacter nosocomialis TaxID=106654 RepID=UPI003215F4B9
MTSQVRKPNEEKAFSIMMNALKARYGCASIIHEQVDKPDYGMIWKNKRVGIEILGIDNSKIIQSIKSHGKKGSKAFKSYNKAISNSIPYTIYNQTTVIDENFVSKDLSKKMELYSSYKANFDEVFLIVHCETLNNPIFLRKLRVIANNYLLDNNCLFRKVYLVDLNRNELVGKIYDSKNKKRYNMTSNLARYTSESSSNQFFLVDEEFKLFKTYNNETK